jgi:hypothetical protein
MRKIILLGLLFNLLSVKAQEKITTYTMWEKEYEIQSTEPSDSAYSLYIDGVPLDKTVDKGGLIVKNEYLDEFINCIKFSREKYVEWTQTAKDNNIKDLKKDVDIKKIPKLGGYFNYGSWHFDFNVKPYFKYTISETKAGLINYSLIIYTGKLQASDNEYIDSDSFVYIFYSINEIDDFLLKLNEELVYNHFGAKNFKGDLFK